jgi:hypothetical protein
MHRSFAAHAPVLALAVLACGALRASPTPDAFQRCHQLGAALLRHCLDETPGRLDDACWPRSRERTAACYAEVKGADAGQQERARAEQERRRAATDARPPGPTR